MCILVQNCTPVWHVLYVSGASHCWDHTVIGDVMDLSLNYLEQEPRPFIAKDAKTVVRKTMTL